MNAFEIGEQVAADKRKLFTLLRSCGEESSPDSVKIIVPNRLTAHVPVEVCDKVFRLYYGLVTRPRILEDVSFLTSLNRRSGLYLDGDIFLKPSITDDEVKHVNVNIARAYLEAYLNELGAISRISNMQCSAYMFMRPKKEFKEDKNAYKSGFHLYFNAISFSKDVKKRAHESLLENIGDYELSSHLRAWTVGNMAEQLDAGPLSGQATLPFSGKPGGQRHQYVGRFDLELQARGGMFFVRSISELQAGNLDLETFLQMIPSYGNRREDASSEYDVVELVVDEAGNDAFIEVINETQLDGLKRLAEDENNSKIRLILELLEILPAEVYAKEHDSRRWVANLLFYEAGRDWARLILRWYYNSVPNGDKGDDKHIRERLDDASVYGQFAHLNGLEQRAREIDAQKADKAIQEYTYNDVAALIQNAYIAGQSLHRATHDAVACALYECIGRDYHAVRTTVKAYMSERLNYRFYHYDETCEFGVAYKKWRPISSIQVPLLPDLKKHLTPALMTVVSKFREDEETFVDDPRSKDKSIKERRIYIINTITAFGEDTFFRAMVNMLTLKIAARSDKLRFEQLLDQDLRYTGCYNGILKADFETGEVVLLDGDNRDIFVSKSLACEYNPALNDQSDAVKELFGYWRDIMPDPELLEFHLLMRSATILGGCGGMHLEIQIGTGADGKTTINNGEDAALGYGDNGYVTTMRPQVLQRGKRDGNAHDGGAADLFGMRKITSLEPSEDERTLDGSAVKYLLSGSQIKMRDVGEKAHSGQIVGLIVLQTNISLTFKQSNVGNDRRIYIVPFNVKFWDESTKEQFSGMKNAKKGCREISDVHMRSKRIREAHLYVWIKYLKTFVSDYGRDIGRIERPRQVAKLTGHIHRASNPISVFIDEKMVFDSNFDERLPLDDVIKSFSNWYQNRRGPDKYTKPEEIIYMLSSSAFQRFIVTENGYNPNQIELLRERTSALYLVNYRFK